MSDEPPYVFEDKCLFCSAPMEEVFYSGSYQTYSKCACPGRAAHYAALEDVRKTAQVAEENLKKFQREKDIAETRDRLRRLEAL